MPEEVPDGSIVITPKEFYDGVRQDISEIKASVAPIPDLKSEVVEQKKRIDKLERVAYIALGVAVGSGGFDLVRYLQ
jgi:hypothetical protein